jgi:uncharacterized membrane protein YkvA (DUF1232 family)
MSTTDLVLVSVAALLGLYAGFVLCLLLAGRRLDARALAGFIPDCLVLFRRLLGDPRVPRIRKFAVVLLIAYLALPIDLVPDFIPIAGQLDDAILVVLTLRFVLAGAGPSLFAEHWPGPPRSAALIERMTF